MRDGEASTTAQRVAAQRLRFERVPAPAGDPAADDRLAADVAGPVQGGDGPMSRYLEARTRFFDRVVVTALDRGIAQVVLAAAGYDGRALRYARPGVRWFEVDHPDTQRDKRSRLERLGISVDDVAFVPADFTVDDVAGGLVAAGIDPGRPSLCCVEGVAVYLARDVLARLLAALAEVSGPGSRLAISLSVDRDDPALAARRARFAASVAAVGEPARTTITADGASELLRTAGWEPRDGDDRAKQAGLVVAVRS